MKWLNGEKIYSCILVIFFLFIISFIISIPIGMINDAREISKTITSEKTYLRSIDYKSSTYGAFVLGSGRIGEEEYYVAYQELDDGGIKLIKLRATDTVIYETLEENEKAYIEVETNGWGATKSTKLFIPKNTINQKYDFSLENE